MARRVERHPEPVHTPLWLSDETTPARPHVASHPTGPFLTTSSRSAAAGHHPEGRGPAMNAQPSTESVRTEQTPWQQTWLDAYPCDVPSLIPYPRAPLSA